MNTNRPSGARLLGDWFNDGFAPELVQLDRSRLLLWEVNGPLNLSPLFPNTNPIPENLRGFGAVPNSPMLPPLRDGDSSQTIDIVIDAPGGEGVPGPPGPAGAPGPNGNPGPDGANGANVCTCAVRIICSTTYTNRAACRVSVRVEYPDLGPDCEGCNGLVAEAWGENLVEITANHSSNSYFPPGFFGAPDPLDVGTLDSFGSLDYAAGVRQTASSQVTYEEKFTGKRGESLQGCTETTVEIPTGCVPVCTIFSELDFGEQASTSYRVVSEASRELTGTGYVDTASETITDVLCDDGVTVPGPTAAVDHTTTIAPPHFCDGGPGQFAASPLVTYPPLTFIVAPACCTNCSSAGSTSGEITAARISEINELALTPSRCIWDYADPMEPTSGTSSGGAASINVVVGFGPSTWYINVSGSYSFVDQVVDPNDGDCGSRDTTFKCEWYGEFEWETSVTFLLEEAP